MREFSELHIPSAATSAEAIGAISTEMTRTMSQLVQREEYCANIDHVPARCEGDIEVSIDVVSAE